MSLNLQPASQEIWDMKYRLKDLDGNPVDADVDATLWRTALALADVEPSSKDYWAHEFYRVMKLGAIPAGRILSNAGAGEFKPKTSLINCTVSDTIPDSMDGILSKVHEAGLTLKAGCGIGYDFSTLRPRGAVVAGAGATTSGPLSFMNIFDSMCFTVSSAGGRRGAQMGTFDISHPNVLDFIKAKREDGVLRQFNLSILITRAFMNAVIEGTDWVFTFEGKECGSMPAKEIWDTIMKSTYDYAEPGFILIDEVNDMNNNWFCEDIRATNPCGEQPLPPYGSCLLGSVNLTKFVTNPFTNRADFDMESYIEVCQIFSRMLDNVVEINGLPLPQQVQEIVTKRRHGMGILGLGSALAMLKVAYGSDEAIEFTEDVTKAMTIAGYEIGIELAKEKGMAPILEDFSVIDGNELSNLHAWVHSNFMTRIWKARPDLKAEAEKHGCRYTHHGSIAPTGTISLSLGNNCSNGIEPSFSHEYSRNVIVEGKNAKEKVVVYSYEALLFKKLFGTSSDLPSYFSDTDNVTPKQHVLMQAAAQKWIDSSISKTINVPTDIPFDEFKDIYMHAYTEGLKGCTTFRFNPEVFQGVLVKQSDLEGTLYKFCTEDTEHVVTGDTEILYEGQTHTAANLYDALKEGYYGKL